MKHYFLSLMLLFSAATIARSDAIDSLINAFDHHPEAATANRFFSILHQGGLMDEPLQLIDAMPPDTLRQQMWYWATEYYHAIQRYDDALIYGEKALPLCHAGSDRVLEGDLLNVLSICCVRKADFKMAATYAKKCNDIDMQLGDPDNISSSLNTLAGIYMSCHQPDEAERYILKALDYAALAGNPARQAVLNGTASEVYKNLKNDTLALQYSKRAYEIETALGRSDKAAVRQTQMASALVGLQRADEAKKVLLQAIPVLREAGNMHSLGIALNNMGLLLIQAHQPDSSVGYFNEALDIFHEQGDIYNEALSHRGLYQALYKTNPSEAMLHNMSYCELRDSLYDKDTGELLSKYAAQYAGEELLEENLQLQRRSHRLMLWGTVGLLVVALAVWLFMLRRNRRWRQRSQELLQRIEAIERQNEVMKMRGELSTLSGKSAIADGQSSMSSEDKEFLERFIQAVEELLPTCQCSVEAIAGKLHVSVSTLYRRITMLAGDNPKSVIQTIQMQKACKMFTEHPDMPIGEVALACGFEEIGNFSRTFKRIINLTPTQFLNSQKPQKV